MDGWPSEGIIPVSIPVRPAGFLVAMLFKIFYFLCYKLWLVKKSTGPPFKCKLFGRNLVLTLLFGKFLGRERTFNPSQRIGTYQNNKSKHCWPCIWKLRPNDRNISVQHIAILLSVTCCARLATQTTHVLRRDATSWVLKIALPSALLCCMDLAKRLQHHATSTNVAWKIWPVSNLSQQHPTCLNMSQHIATGWLNARNMFRPTILRYVSLKRWDRLAGASGEGPYIRHRGSVINCKLLDCRLNKIQTFSTHTCIITES